MSQFKVILPGKIHFAYWLIEDIESRRQKWLSSTTVNENEETQVVAAYKETLLDDDDLGELKVIGHPDEDLLPGRVLLVGPGISVECDANELTRALKPFIQNNHTD